MTFPRSQWFDLFYFFSYMHPSNRFDFTTQEFETVKRQNSLLREIVEDSYKNQAAAIDKVLEEKELELQERERRKRTKFRNADTQIACVVCAKREHLLSHDPHVNEATPLVHESMARALDGDFVLVAKPRHINGILSRSFIRNDNDDPGQSPVTADPIIHALQKMKASGNFNSISDFNVSSARPPLTRSSTDKQLLPSGRPPLVRASSETSQIGDFSQHLLRPSSAQAGGKSVKQPLQLGYGDPHSNVATDLPSKFSRINQIPTTIQSPKAVMSKNKAPSRDRVLPNTAAYLQGKILADSNYIHQNNSDPHILSEHEPARAKRETHLDALPSARSPKRDSQWDRPPSSARSPKRGSQLDRK